MRFEILPIVGFIALLAVAWNLLALVLSWFGFALPVVDSGVTR